MSNVLSRELPAPKHWQEFEAIAFDVYRRLWGTNDAELHGRKGQPQAGVDVYGMDRKEKVFVGVQCKGKDADYGGLLSEAELRREVAKALTFQPPLGVFVLATTAPNDSKIQEVARSISAAHAKASLFEVRVTGWDTLRQYVADDQDLMLKYFRDFAPVDVAAQMSANAQEQRQSSAMVLQMVASTNRMIAEARTGQDGSDALAARVTEISRLVADGSPRAAINALDRVLAAEASAASPLAMYRIYATKGNAQYALGNEKGAIGLYRQAYDAHPDHPNARTTMAIVHLLEGNRDAALELAIGALRDDPTSARAAGVVIDASSLDRTMVEIEALIGDNLLPDPEIKLHLAMRAHLLGDDASHLKFSEEALVLLPDDWRVLSAVAESLMQPLAALDGLALTHALPDEQRPDVVRATDLMARAWAILAERDSSFQGRHVAANLISLLGLMGRDAEAEIVLDQALAGSPTYGPLLQRAAQRAASFGDWLGSAGAIDAVPADQVSTDMLLMRVQAAIELRDVATARRVLDQLDEAARAEDPAPGRDQLLTALRVRVEILDGSDQEVMIDDALVKAPGSIVIRSILFDDVADGLPLRARIASEIRDLARGELTLRDRVHAAETLYDAGNYSLAADLYEPLHDMRDSHALRRRLQALYHADRRAEARKLFEALPKTLRVSPGYLSIGVNIYERSGMLRPAFSLIQAAIAANDVLPNRLAWAQLLIRLPRLDDLVSWLRRVDEDIEGDPTDLMSLARTMAQYAGNDRRALAIGYRALRAGYGDPAVHLSFAMGLIISGKPDQDAMASPQQVIPGSGVVLANDDTGETLFRIVETGARPVIERGELGIDDPFASRLLGLRKDDVIRLDKVGSSPRTYRVKEVESRYLFAFRRTMRDFPTLFPQNPAFGSIDIDEAKGDARFEQVFALARDRSEYTRDVERMYREGIMPLAMVARFTSTSVFDLWDGFSRSPASGLKTSIGIDTEFNLGRNAAMRGVTIVDPVTIYGWCRMDIAPIIARLLMRLGVVQATIDALRQSLDHRTAQRGTRSGSFGWDGEHYNMVEMTEDFIDRQIEAASVALAFAEALILVPAETEERPKAEVMDLLDGLDRAYHDTLIAALNPKRAVLTDDIGFRAIVQEAGGHATWTQAFAQAALGADSFPQADYRLIVCALLDANHKFIQFGAPDILGELQDANWTISDRLRRFAFLMSDDAVDRSSVARLLAHILVNSRTTAPDAKAFCSFHIEVARAARAADRFDRMLADYDAALPLAQAMLGRLANRIMLPRKLLASTYHTTPAHLAKEGRDVASMQMKKMGEALVEGGFAEACR